MIGVFDSGLGGLTVLKEFLKQLPDYNYIYLGDNARAPYGSKSSKLVYNFTVQAVDFLFKQGCELIIVACNTASAKALRRVQQEWLPKNYPKKRILGVIIPTAEVVADKVNANPKQNKVGVIGTKATIDSQVYETEIKKLCSSAHVINQACPLLVPLVEEGWVARRETKMILRYYLRPLKNKKINTLVLGCTHYPFLLKQIKEVMGKNCEVLDSPKLVGKKLKDYLARHPEIEEKIKEKKRLVFYTTDEVDQFKELGEKFLKIKMKDVEKIKL